MSVVRPIVPPIVAPLCGVLGTGLPWESGEQPAIPHHFAVDNLITEEGDNLISEEGDLLIPES